MKELAFARQRTIERLGETVPDIPIASAVDFILPVNCRRSTTAVRAASATAVKMNSSQVEPRHAAPPAMHQVKVGTIDVRRQIIRPSLGSANATLIAATKPLLLNK